MTHASYRGFGSRAAAQWIFCAVVLVSLGIVFTTFVPRPTFAAAQNADLGGGNALMRAATGIAHATSTSDILAHLQFASTRGGRPADVPPSQDDGSNTDDSTQPGDPSSDVGGGGNGANNGGASGGTGGNGGNASNGGLVRTGDATSTVHTIDTLNFEFILVRIRL